MVTRECERQGYFNTLCDKAAPSDDVFASTCSTGRMSVDRSSDQAQYIDVNLAASPQWGRMTSRRLQNSSDSQEFEFSMPGLATDLVEEAQVAPADELFYKGQLLPLQPDPRLHLVQTLSCNESPLEGDMPSRLILSSARVHDASKFYSCRIAGFDASAVNSRCSSFRSQNSGYWESGDKDTGDSSSSRDSNGSSQDSYFAGEKGGAQGAKSLWGSRRRGAFNWRSLWGGWKRGANAKKRENSSNGIAYSAELRSVGRKQESYNQGVEEGLWQELKRVSSARRPADEKEDDGRKGKRDAERQRWHSKERWQGYARKLMMLHKLETGRSFLGIEECAKHTACQVKSSTTSTTRSDPRLLHLKLDDLASSSRSFLSIASCPASILSSPTHSGLLVPSPPPPPSTSPPAIASSSLSTMQELHSAVQGAIAHCKESMMGANTHAGPSPSISRHDFPAS